MFTCGLLRSNFSLAMFLYPQRQNLFTSQLETNRHHHRRKKSRQILERGTGFEPATITLEE
jgi:hypothetical protein